jgi:transcriptional regulator with XRE-family HTH domain
MDAKTMSVGNPLTEARNAATYRDSKGKLKRMSMAVLAQRSGVGKTTLYEVERGARRLPLSAARSICVTLYQGATTQEIEQKVSQLIAALDAWQPEDAVQP